MPEKISRRRALTTIGTMTVGAAGAGTLHAQGSADALDRAMLDALAEVVLPSELGASGRRDVVAAFLRWIRNYKEGADTDHGYGNTRIRSTGPAPARDYPAQLAALESAARAAGAPGFRQATMEQRRALVTAAITESRIQRLPPRPSGGHIAADLMAHYFHSSAAADLCYRAAIGRDTCRGLPGSDKPPRAL